MEAKLEVSLDSWDEGETSDDEEDAAQSWHCFTPHQLTTNLPFHSITTQLPIAPINIRLQNHLRGRTVFSCVGLSLMELVVAIGGRVGCRGQIEQADESITLFPLLHSRKRALELAVGLT